MKFISFDIETTGFIPGVDQITEIAAVRFENGEPTEMFVSLVNPGRNIPEGAQKVSGITDAMVKDAPIIDSLMEPFAEFCGEDTIVAHNAGFDFQFVAHNVQRLECKAPKGFVLDTLALSKKVLPGLMNYKLGTVVQHLGIQTDVFHRAQQDATYCGYLFHKIVQKMSLNGMPPQLETLIQISGKPLKFPQIVKQPKQLDLLSL